MSGKLIIFDYSGTLSLEAVVFGRSDNLIHHLQKSGLSALGVDNAALFWKIVNETWQEGSTTSAGYKKVMQEFIAKLFPQKAIANREEIDRSVSTFVDAYLDHSRIDERWRSILERLSLDKSVEVIVATDHYAEATDAIINHFAGWDIQAVSLISDIRSNFVVANSADVGVHKAHQQFWLMVKNILQLNYNRILLIDDFGQNEQPDDAYVDSEKINERRQMTQKILRDIFAADVQIISFVAKDEQVTAMIAEASGKIEQFLL
ncbi:MAG: hypothetical protein ABFD75_05745 [Smithella sp.]